MNIRSNLIMEVLCNIQTLSFRSIIKQKILITESSDALQKIDSESIKQYNLKNRRRIVQTILRIEYQLWVFLTTQSSLNNLIKYNQELSLSILRSFLDIYLEHRHAIIKD